MKWIKYQIVCGKNENEEDILINKKVGYSNENLAIAEEEAYDGYKIIDDEQSFEKEPLAIEFGGTGASTAAQAMEILGITAALAGKQPLGNYLESETDPTVPSWAKQLTKPSYTAAEVGARPNTWMPTAAQVGARPSTWMPTAAQVGARSNSWLPTPAEIGAEPAIADSSHPGCYYRMVSGVKEWVNPPMIAGVEYRTTKRYNGNPIYTKNIDCGTMPVGSSSGPMTATVATGTNHLKVTNWYIYIVSGDELCNLPMISSGEITADAWMSHSFIHLRSWRDYSSYYAHTIIEYIK